MPGMNPNLLGGITCEICGKVPGFNSYGVTLGIGDGRNLVVCNFCYQDIINRLDLNPHLTVDEIVADLKERKY